MTHFTSVEINGQATFISSKNGVCHQLVTNQIIFVVLKALMFCTWYFKLRKEFTEIKIGDISMFKIVKKLP